MILKDIENRFNFKIIKYPNGQIQLRYYQNPIILGVSKTEKQEINISSLISMKEIEEKHTRTIKESVRRTLNTLQDLSRSNEWEWFLTFTFAKTKVDRYDYKQCMKKLSKWLNNIKTRHAPSLQYLIVPEQHKSGAWHFHGLLKGIPPNQLQIAINHNIHSKYYRTPLRTTYPDGKFIYNVTSYSLGWTTATRIEDTFRASNYILKYVTKNVIARTPNQRRYLCSKNLPRPTVINDIISPMEWEEIMAKGQFQNKKVTYHTSWKVTSNDYENYIQLLELN